MLKALNKQDNSRALKTFLRLIIATTMIIIFIILALILAPRPSIPEFEITDRNGSWEAQGTVAVFDDTIKPGSNGEYYFKLKNDSDVTLRYGIIMKEYVSNTIKDALQFMQYRLKMNGVNIDNDDSWHYIDDLDYYDILILPDTEQLMTLEWRWPFEENDINDTFIGRTGGNLSVVFFVWAEVVA